MFDSRYSLEPRNGHLVPSSGASKQRKRLTICIVDLSPETVSRRASAVLIAKYGTADRHLLDNCFAARLQQHLVFPFSVAPSAVPPTHPSFIWLVNIGRNHFRNDKLYIFALETFGSVVEWRPLRHGGIDLIAEVISKSTASHSHLQHCVRLDLDIPVHLHVHFYVRISPQFRIHIHILGGTTGILFFIFGFCRLFFVVPQSLHPHSTTQVQLRCQLLIQSPFALRRQWREAVLIVFASATGVRPRGLLSSFAVCPCDL
jgi:hypothetical protein